jgi:hypothetical protein
MAEVSLSLGKDEKDGGEGSKNIVVHEMDEEKLHVGDVVNWCHFKVQGSEGFDLTRVDFSTV